MVRELSLQGGQYRTREDDGLGERQLHAIADAVNECRFTVLIASSAARWDKLAQFAAELAQHTGLERDVPRLIVVARDFRPGSDAGRARLPLEQRALVSLDCSDEASTGEALARLRKLLALDEPIDEPLACPCPGLAQFTEANRDLLFGRDGDKDAVLQRIRGGHMRILIVGPSGSGKSSFIHAAVLPELPVRDHVVQVVPRGGDLEKALLATVDRLEVPELTSALQRYRETVRGASDEQVKRARASLCTVPVVDARRRVVVIDPLEEIFTQDDEAIRDALFTLLGGLWSLPWCSVILCMRADFYGALMRERCWRELEPQQYPLAPLDETGLRAAIIEPARRAGVHIDAALVERLIREIDRDRSSVPIPLLQVALRELWAHRSWRYLTVADYERISQDHRHGLAAVLTVHAEAILQTLAELDDRAVAQRILIDLVHLGEGRPHTRRRRSLDDLRRHGDAPGQLERVVKQLVEGRLVTTGDRDEATARRADSSPGKTRHVDLAHDALITGWSVLAGWIADHHARLRTQRRLEARAASGGRLTGDELPEFLQWVAWTATPAGRWLGTSETLQVLVRRSVAARRRRRVGLGLGLVAMTVAAIGFKVQAERLGEEKAKTQQLLAQSYAEQGGQRLVDGQPQEAIPYLLAAREAGNESVPLRVLFWAASRHLPVVPALEHRAQVRSAAFSPDGTRVVTASLDHTARVWDAATGKPLTRPLAHRGQVVSAAFSPDGTRVVTASYDRTAQVWDVATGTPLTRLEHQDAVESAAFSSDGTRVVTTSNDHTARVWDAVTGKPLTGPLAHQGIVLSAAFSPDGTRVVTASDDKTAQVWDAATGKPLTSPLAHRATVWRATFSSDGTRVVTASEDQTARVWDATAGKPLTDPLSHRGPVLSAAFSPDGTRIVTGSRDTTAQVWDAATGRSLISLHHSHEVLGAAFSPDGAHIVTASVDHTARVWDATDRRPLTRRFAHRGEAVNAAFSPDGTRIVIANRDNTARVWDAATGKLVAGSLAHQDKVASVAFSPDGTRIVTASEDRTARVWDAATGKPLTGSLAHQDRWSP